jgi:hypothetical protein
LRFELSTRSTSHAGVLVERVEPLRERLSGRVDLLARSVGELLEEASLLALRAPDGQAEDSRPARPG